MTDGLVGSLFDSGRRYGEWKAAMRENQEVIAEVEGEIELSPSAEEALRRLARPLRALAIAEDWCRDSVDNLPIVAALAEASGKLDLRVFTKAEHPELMALFLKEGKYESLPVFAFFDEDWRELGRFIERPDSVTELRARLKRERGGPDMPMSQLPEAERARVRGLIEDIRRETRAFATAELQRELTAIFERARVTALPS